MTRVAPVAFTAVLLATSGPGCGTDVSLGGAPDAAAPDTATTAPLECSPCLEQGDCALTATCGVFSGDSFCATLCPNGDGCDPDETCDSVTTVGGSGLKACVPNGGVCAPQAGPQVDGGPLDRCGALNGPTVASGCHSCGKYSSDCQANGCYGGWWCSTTTRKCQKPPKTCP